MKKMTLALITSLFATIAFSATEVVPVSTASIKADTPVKAEVKVVEAAKTEVKVAKKAKKVKPVKSVAVPAATVPAVTK